MVNRKAAIAALGVAGLLLVRQQQTGGGGGNGGTGQPTPEIQNFASRWSGRTITGDGAVDHNISLTAAGQLRNGLPAAAYNFNLSPADPDASVTIIQRQNEFFVNIGRMTSRPMEVLIDGSVVVSFDDQRGRTGQIVPGYYVDTFPR